MSKIKRWLGIEKRSSYVDAYIDTANFKSSIYMSVVVIVLELWMIMSLVQRWVGGDTSRSRLWFVQHLAWYLLFLVSAVCMLIFAICYLKGIFKKRIPGKIIMVIFSCIALYFGVSVSYSDYTKGEQILCFSMMIVYVFGILNWRPIVSISLTTFVFILFYNMMKNAPQFPISYATKVNFFTFWIAIVMLSLAVYQQRLSEAEKDESLENSSIRDELTGIPNMFYFRKRATEILNEEGADGKLFLFLNIANFKAFNEKYGFDAGSDFIKTTAAKVDSCFSHDLFARFSDDHFVVLTSNDGIKERLRDLTEDVEGHHDSTHLTLKAGGYVPSDPSEDPSLACDRARYACSTIKKRFGRYYCEYDKNMDEGFHKRQYIITHIDEAIRRGYIKVYYQPVVWANDRNICSVEALARWIDPDYGFLSPGEFIPALEEYRLIQHIDLEIFSQVCRDIRNALDDGRKVVPVSINFSRLDFELENMKEEIDQIVTKYNVPKEYIHVEITESALIANDASLKNNLRFIKEMGIELWLDDFGSGYSSLNALKDYSFDVMKIDMVFLNQLTENEKAKTILKSIVKMADMIDMETLTEGVEEEYQAEFLKEIGCKRLQGYLFGKPMPIEDLRRRYRCF